MMFPPRGSIHHHWPPFGPGTVSSEAHAKDLTRKRSEDVRILDGVVGGLEVSSRIMDIG